MLVAYAHLGGAVIRRPEMFRAVVARGGVYDMLRLKRTPEYGSVADEKPHNPTRAQEGN